MAYIGPKPSQTLATPTSQYFNGTGSQTVFTLNRAVNVPEDLEVFVNNIQQEPGVGKSYTAIGTTLTFDVAPSSGTANVYVVYRGLAEVTTRLEHDPNAALAATTGTFSGNVDVTGTVTADGLTIDTNSNLSPAYFLRNTGTNQALAIGIDDDDVIFNSIQDEQYGGYEFKSTFDGTGTQSRLSIANNGDISFYEDTGTTAKLFWDASEERLGINQTSPVRSLHVVDDSADPLIVERSTTGNTAIRVTDDTDTVYFGMPTGGGFAVDDDANLASGPWLKIDTSGNVGIGTSSPTNALDVRGQSVFGSGTDGVKLTYSAGNSTGIIDTGFTSTGLEFRIGNSFAAKIDSSGNVGINTDDPVGILDARANSTSRVYINSSGDLIVESSNGGDVLQLIDSAATSETNANPYMEFLYSTSLGASTTRLGYLGFGSTNNTDLYFSSEASNSSLRFYADSNLGMTISSDGEVTKPDQPSFMVTKNADQTLTVNSNTTITWENQTWDVGGNFDFALNKFEAPVTGKYYLHTQMRIDNLDTATGYYLLAITTSNRTKYVIVTPKFTSDLAYYSMSVGSVFDMDDGDTASVYVTQSSGTASHIDDSSAYTSFSGYLLG